MISTGKILCIAGPTGAGKTALALRIAAMIDRMGGKAHIINADSRQVYKDFPIITAQPTQAEQRMFPHFLYGWLPSDKKISAGEWARLAGKAVKEAMLLDHIPILVGGTGFYLKAFLDGISEIPPVPAAIHQRIIDEREAYGTEYMHQKLLAIDSEYASKIHPHDKQRIMRALEVWESTGCTFTWWHKQKTPAPDYHVLRLGMGLSLEELTPLFQKRIRKMLDDGALDEAKRALVACPDRKAPGWSGIGCLEVHRYLEGELSLQECIDLWSANTRAYAKRQWTWFKADPRIIWLTPSQQSTAEELAGTFLF